MNSRRLAKIEAELQKLGRSPRGLAAEDLIGIAQRLGRTRSNRGKEPTFVRESEPILCPPLSIPNHSGDLKIGTARSIIDALLNDVDVWKQHLMEIEEDGAENEE